MPFWWRSEARLSRKNQQMVLTASPRSPNHRSAVHTAKDMMTSFQKGCNIVRLVVWTGLIDAMANIDRCAVNRRLLAKAVWRRSGRVVVEKIYAVVRTLHTMYYDTSSKVLLKNIFSRRWRNCHRHGFGVGPSLVQRRNQAHGRAPVVCLIPVETNYRV